MASMLGDTHTKAKWLLMQILFNPVKSPNKLDAERQRSQDSEATMRPNLLKGGRSVNLTSPSLRTSSLQSYYPLMISYFRGSELVDGSLHVKYTIFLHNDGISFMQVRKCYIIQRNNNAKQEKENFKGLVYILNYSPLNSVFTYPY